MATILYLIVMFCETIGVCIAYYSGQLDNDDLTGWFTGIIAIIFWPIINPIMVICKLVVAIEEKKRKSETSNEEP